MLFPNLFREGSIGGLRLRNRIIMPLYPTNYAQDSQVDQRMLAFYGERARGGVALIVLDGPCLNYPEAYKGKQELRWDTPSHREGIQRLLHTIQSEGACAFMHLNYPKERIVDQPLQGAKPKGDRWVQPLVNAVTMEEIEEILSIMASGAVRAREMGYDGVEIQASYGDLIAQLLSPLTNQRVDEYGGPLGGRARFLLELIRGVKAEAGRDFPVMMKLVCDEFVEGGLHLEEACQVAAWTEEAGADAIVANGGNKATKFLTIPGHALHPGPLVHLAEGIKEAIRIPVVAIGKINGPLLAEEILSDGRADFVAMARPLIADPQLPTKAQGGRPEEIRGCIYCLEDCAEDGVPGIGRCCAVNPFSGQEGRLELRPASRKKKVMVIGGGPAGMQAALLARQRGHTVSLLERAAELGGQFRWASMAQFKEEVSELLRYLSYQLQKEDVIVYLHREAGLRDVIRHAPDAVILASGSRPSLPAIGGMERPFVLHVRQVYEGGVEIGQRVIVLGGGDIGCETAEMLAVQGKAVTVIEVLPTPLPNMKGIPRDSLLGRLEDRGVRIRTGTRALEVQEGGVLLEDAQGKRLSAEADTVVVAIGSEPEISLLEQLKTDAKEVHVVGDAAQVGNVGAALRSAAEVGLGI